MSYEGIAGDKLAIETASKGKVIFAGITCSSLWFYFAMIDLIEMRSLKSQFLEHFKDYWNWIDATSLVLNGIFLIKFN